MEWGDHADMMMVIDALKMNNKVVAARPDDSGNTTMAADYTFNGTDALRRGTIATEWRGRWGVRRGWADDGATWLIYC